MVAFSDRDFACGEIIALPLSTIKSTSSEDDLLVCTFYISFNLQQQFQLHEIKKRNFTIINS